MLDGVVPDNIRSGCIVRNGARYGREYLNANIGSFFAKVVPTVIEHMGDMLPEF
jgi:alanyl-tRNA synthetase